MTLSAEVIPSFDYALVVLEEFRNEIVEPWSPYLLMTD